jgi:hypothetical protein
MHGSSALGAADRTLRSTIAPDGMKAFHDVLASIAMSTPRFLLSLQVPAHQAHMTLITSR